MKPIFDKQIIVIQQMISNAALPKGRYNIDLDIVLENSDKVAQPIPTIQCREKRISGQILELLEQWIFNSRKSYTWHRIRIYNKERLEYLECPIHSDEMETVVRTLNTLNEKEPTNDEESVGNGLYVLFDGDMSIYDVKRR
jgi:hypothetical protein